MRFCNVFQVSFGAILVSKFLQAVFYIITMEKRADVIRWTNNLSFYYWCTFHCSYCAP